MSFSHGGNILSIARTAGLDCSAILDFSASINPLGPPAGLAPAIMAALETAVHYPDSEATELRQELAAFHHLHADNFYIGNGSTELIYLLPRLIQAQKALVVAPPFSEYARALAAAGWEVAYHLLSDADDFRLDPIQVAAAAKEADLLILCNPGNPAGNIASAEAVSLIIRTCRKNVTFVIVDEAFADFCEECSVKKIAAREEGIAVLRSMTKFYAIPGLRLGYVVGHPDFIGRVAAAREPWSVNHLAQAAGVAALRDEEYRQRTLDFVAREREFLSGGLSELPGVKVFPSAANYLLARLPEGASAAVLAERMLERRILIRDCSNFYGLDERFFRVAVRTREENERLLDVLRELVV